jgi:methylenetetrahydrofolate reductase (NADPH)
MARVGSKFASPSVKRVVGETTFELVPLKNLDAQLAELPDGAKVSVTCSPVKGIDATLDLAAKLKASGLRPTPHIAARLVRDRGHVRDIADRLRGEGFEELFVIAGDEQHPAGEYDGALALIRHLVEENHGLSRIGVAGYPDGHVFIDDETLRSALHAKETVLKSAGVDGWVSTQMCFDQKAIVRWLTAERTAGLTLPIRLGIPGPIDRTKLLTMGARVGVGQSLRYLKKNGSGLRKLLTGTSYNPTTLLSSIGNDLDHLDVNGLHLFTFNQLGASVTWQREVTS